MPPKVETKLVNERSTDIVVRRQNLETRTIGKSVIASAVSTDHIEVRGTGADAGTGDVSLWLKKTGVKPGLYNQVKVDEYGRVIQASYVDNAGSGATDATIWNQNLEAQAANFWISGNGRVNGSFITGSLTTGSLSVSGAVNFAVLTLDTPLAVTSGGTGTASVAAKSFFAGPVNGTDAAPAWRFIVASDLPPIPFTFLTGLPNTLQLHGITDAYTKTQVDSLVSGLVTRTTAQTITAEKTFTAGIKIANVGDPETSYLLSSVAGELYWNGSAVGTSSFTASRVPFGASSGGSLTESGNLTFTLNGGYPELVVGSPTSAFSSYIIADAAVGVGAGYGFREGGVNRWIWNFDSNDANKPFKVRSYSSLGAYIDSPLEIENASGGTILVGGSTARLLSVTGAVTITGVLTVNNRSVFTTTMSAHGSVNTILVTANHDQSSGAAWALTAATRFKSGAGADSDAKGHTSFTTFQDSVSVASSGLNKARGFYAVAAQNDASNSSCGVYYGYSTLTGSGSGVTSFTTYASFAVDDENYVNAAFTNRFGLLVKTGNVIPSAGWFGVYIEDGPASPSRYSIYTGNAPSRFGGSVELPSFTPASTANRLYSASGTLYWNGNPVGDVKKFTVSDIAPSSNTSMTSAWISRHTRIAPTTAVNIVVESGIASVGDEIQLLQSNTTFFTLTAGSGVTLRCATSQTTIQPRAQWSCIRLICVATDAFDVTGDFTL